MVNIQNLLLRYSICRILECIPTTFTAEHLYPHVFFSFLLYHVALPLPNMQGVYHSTP